MGDVSIVGAEKSDPLECYRQTPTWRAKHVAGPKLIHAFDCGNEPDHVRSFDARPAVARGADPLQRC